MWIRTFKCSHLTEYYVLVFGLTIYKSNVAVLMWKSDGSKRCSVTEGAITSFNRHWSCLKLPGSSSFVIHASVLFSLMSCMYGDTSAQRVCLHGAALGLFMELSCKPGAGNSCGAPTHPSGPTTALKLGKCHRFVNALFPLLLSLLIPLLQDGGSGTGHVLRFLRYTNIKTPYLRPQVQMTAGKDA